MKAYLAIAAVIGVALSCGVEQSDGDGGAGGSGTSGAGGGEATLSCTKECTNKATACGVVASKVCEVCEGVCQAGPTATQLQCLSQSDCTQLQAAAQCGIQVVKDARCAAGGGPNTGGGMGNTGGGSASGGGSQVPSAVNIAGSFGGTLAVTTVPSSDGKTLTSVINAEANPVTFSPTGFDVKLDKAKTKQVIAPTAGASCSSAPTLSSSDTSHNVLRSWSGADTLPATGCADLAKAIKASGLTVEYTNVPYANAASVIAKVKVTLRP